MPRLALALLLALHGAIHLLGFAKGLALADVRTVRIEVGGDGQAPEGRLGIDDLEVTR